MRSARWTLAPVALAALGLATPARAQVMELVELKDGSTYQGQLVERVEGVRVVIQLATGEVKRFSWDRVARAVQAYGAPPPSPSPPASAPALPPLPTPATEPTPPPSATPAADSSHVITGWPDPHSVPAEKPAPAWTPALDLGLVSSLPQFGSPRGILGVMAGYEPLRWAGLEVSGAYDGPVEVAEGNLGWSVAETLRVGHGFGLGAGLSQHFGATGSGVAQMGHAELYFDLDLTGMTTTPIVIRMAPGLTTMFNGAEHPGACGFFNLQGGNTDESGNPTDKSCLVFYFDLEVFYRMGGERE